MANGNSSDPTPVMSLEAAITKFVLDDGLSRVASGAPFAPNYQNHLSAWYLDATSNVHMAAERDWFFAYQPFESIIAITFPNGVHFNVAVLGVGRVKLPTGFGHLELFGVLHVPNAPCNVIAVSRLAGFYEYQALPDSNQHQLVSSRDGVTVGLSVACGQGDRLRLREDLINHDLHLFYPTVVWPSKWAEPGHVPSTLWRERDWRSWKEAVETFAHDNWYIPRGWSKLETFERKMMGTRAPFPASDGSHAGRATYSLALRSR